MKNPLSYRIGVTIWPRCHIASKAESRRWYLTSFAKRPNEMYISKLAIRSLEVPLPPQGVHLLREAPAAAPQETILRSRQASRRVRQRNEALIFMPPSLLSNILLNRLRSAKTNRRTGEVSNPRTKSGRESNRRYKTQIKKLGIEKRKQKGYSNRAARISENRMGTKRLTRRMNEEKGDWKHYAWLTRKNTPENKMDVTGNVRKLYEPIQAGNIKSAVDNEMKNNRRYAQRNTQPLYSYLTRAMT